MQLDEPRVDGLMTLLADCEEQVANGRRDLKALAYTLQYTYTRHLDDRIVSEDIEWLDKQLGLKDGIGPAL
jgi:hypothetical protein